MNHTNGPHEAKNFSIQRSDNLSMSKKFTQYLGNWVFKIEGTENLADYNDKILTSTYQLLTLDGYHETLCVLIGHLEGYQIWKFIQPENKTPKIVQVISKKLGKSISIIKAIEKSHSLSANASYIPTIATVSYSEKTGRNSSCLNLKTLDSSCGVNASALENEIDFNESIENFASNRYVIVVSTYNGKIHILNNDKNESFKIQNVYICYCSSEVVPVFALGQYWLAFQTTKSSVNYKAKKGKVEKLTSIRGKNNHLKEITGNSVKVFFQGTDLVKRVLSASFQQNAETVNTNPKESIPNNSGRPGVIEIIDVVSHETISLFSTGNKPIIKMDFDKSGLLLASACDDGQELYVWKSYGTFNDFDGSAKPIYRLSCGNLLRKIIDITFNEDSTLLSVMSSTGTIHIFPIMPNGAEPTFTNFTRLRREKFFELIQPRAMNSKNSINDPFVRNYSENKNFFATTINNPNRFLNKSPNFGTTRNCRSFFVPHYGILEPKKLNIIPSKSKRPSNIGYSWLVSKRLNSSMPDEEKINCYLKTYIWTFQGDGNLIQRQILLSNDKDNFYAKVTELNSWNLNRMNIWEEVCDLPPLINLPTDKKESRYKELELLQDLELITHRFDRNSLWWVGGQFALLVSQKKITNKLDLVEIPFRILHDPKKISNENIVVFDNKIDFSMNTPAMPKHENQEKNNILNGKKPVKSAYYEKINYEIDEYTSSDQRVPNSGDSYRSNQNFDNRLDKSSRKLPKEIFKIN